jgi:plastocyanin
MIQIGEGRLRWADVGWLAAAAGMFMLFIGQTIFARAGEGAVNVGIDNFKFAPGALTVRPGVSVTFENHDGMVHNIVAVGGLFRSTGLDTNDKFSFTFDKPGEYPYFCGLHPFMKGKVVVAP